MKRGQPNDTSDIQKELPRLLYLEHVEEKGSSTLLPHTIATLLIYSTSRNDSLYTV